MVIGIQDIRVSYSKILECWEYVEAITYNLNQVVVRVVLS